MSDWLTKAPWLMPSQRIETGKIPVSMKQVIDKLTEDNKELLEGREITFYTYNTDLISYLYELLKEFVVGQYLRVYSDEEYNVRHDTYLINNDTVTVIACDHFFNDGDRFAVLYSKLSNDDTMSYLDSLKPEEEIVNFEPGTYVIKRGMSGYSVESLKLAKEDFAVMNEDYSELVVGDVKEFFKSEKFYVDNNLTYKRGILMYGLPGTGKTTLCRKILHELNSKTYNIIVDGNEEVGEGLFSFITKTFKNKPKVLIFEDIDSMEQRQRSSLLNFLDGVKDTHNTFYIATTNHPEQMDGAILNRPSRFDTVKEIELPNKESREKLLLHYFPSLEGDELSKAIRDTEGFSGAYFKELFVFCKLRGVGINEAIATLQAQNKQFSDYAVKSKDGMFG